MHVYFCIFNYFNQLQYHTETKNITEYYLVWEYISLLTCLPALRQTVYIRNLPYEIFAYPKYHYSQGSFQEMSLYEPEKRENNYSFKISYFVMNFVMSRPQNQTIHRFIFIELQTLNCLHLEQTQTIA